MRHHIQTTILFLSVLFLGQSVIAQIGVRTKYLSNSINNDIHSKFNAVNNSNVDLLSTGYGIGIDYWFRLKDKRIEFLPEIDYSYSRTILSIGIEEQKPLVPSVKSRTVGVNINTRVYILDFDGDCNCPTFSNQSTLIKKGFYLVLSPGIQYNDISLVSRYDPTPTLLLIRYLTNDFKHISYKLGVGTGLDIGISNLITLNPYIMYNLQSNKYWDVSQPINGASESKTNATQLELGIRFAIRLDSKNY